MTGKTIYLHAGMHKTGSTSIQSYLHAHRDIFRARGIYVMLNSDIAADPRGGRVAPANSCGMAHILLRPGLATPIRVRDQVPEYDDAERRAAIAEIRAFLARITTEKVIVSAEAFSFLKTSEERGHLDALARGHILQPIIFLRERTSWLKSWERQVAKLLDHATRKDLRNDGKIAGYAEHVLDSSPDSPVGRHEDIRNFFGPDATYLSYEEAMERDGSVIPSFLRAVGLDPATMPDPGAAEWQNRTFYQQDDIDNAP